MKYESLFLYNIQILIIKYYYPNKLVINISYIMHNVSSIKDYINPDAIYSKKTSDNSSMILK